MENNFEAGDKIQYRLFDKKGKAHWLDGAIHGVKRYEDPSGVITNLTYLVDTGRNTRVDEKHRDKRALEVEKRAKKIMKTGKTQFEALIEIDKHTDLPDSELVVLEVRQPEQIELPAEHIRPRK